MKQTRILLLVCLYALIPALARADDGGWWDTLWKWDTKLTGVSTEFHLLCLDQAGRRVVGCEEWFKGLLLPFKGDKKLVHKFEVLANPAAPVASQTLDRIEFEDIKHEINLRVGYYRNFGDRYPPPDPSIRDSINALKTMATYHYHINKYMAVGGGAGYVTIYGTRFDLFSRSILTPVSYIIYPAPGDSRWGALVLRAEVNYIPEGFTAADFGDAADPTNPTKVVSNFSNKNEWSATIGIGFDLRRVGCFKDCTP